MSRRTNDRPAESFRLRSILFCPVSPFVAQRLQPGVTSPYRRDMHATIFHNPHCGTSRKTLDILRESGAEVAVREYLKDPPERAELERLYRRAGISPREGLRAKEPLAAELGLMDADDDRILDAMVEHPILINRPLVETGKGVRLCRPQEVVREIL
jgi:arsenate reductase